MHFSSAQGKMLQVVGTCGGGEDTMNDKQRRDGRQDLHTLKSTADNPLSNAKRKQHGKSYQKLSEVPHRQTGSCRLKETNVTGTPTKTEIWNYDALDLFTNVCCWSLHLHVRSVNFQNLGCGDRRVRKPFFLRTSQSEVEPERYEKGLRLLVARQPRGYLNASLVVLQRARAVSLCDALIPSVLVAYRLTVVGGESGRKRLTHRPVGRFRPLGFPARIVSHSDFFTTTHE